MYTKRNAKFMYYQCYFAHFFSRAAVLILNYPKVLREPMANPLMRYGKKKLKPVI